MNENVFEIITDSAEATVALGERIGGALKGGEIITLIGQLGSGKTHLIKGISAGLGVGDCDEVNSPTFVIVNEYSSDDGRIVVGMVDPAIGVYQSRGKPFHIVTAQ